MRDRATFVAFLMMCFAVVGLTGLFASYGPLIPLERALARSAVLDQALLAGRGPDAAAQLEAMRPALGFSADAVLQGPGDIVDRVMAARAVVLSEEAREGASVAYRTRLMLGIVTVLAALFGAGVMAMALRQA